MSEASRGGRTVLFVSHNMHAVTTLCSRALLLEKGNITFDGRATEGVQKYLAGLQGDIVKWTGNEGDENVVVVETVISPAGDGVFFTDNALTISITFQVKRKISNLVAGFTLRSEFGFNLAYCLYDDYEVETSDSVEPGIYKKRFRIPPDTLARGSYDVIFDIGIHNVKRIIQTAGSLRFSLTNRNRRGCRFVAAGGPGYTGLFRPDWSVGPEAPSGKPNFNGSRPVSLQSREH
jgi:lipopolysaccharide transport system ATP-binding protein